MPVAISHTQERSALNFSGELNIYLAAETMAQIKAELKSDLPIQVDLSEVDEIDAAGLQVLIALRLFAISHGLPFSVVAQSDVVMELLEMSDMAGFFGATVVLSEIAA